MRYYVLSTPGRPDEVARMRRRSAASYYDPASQKWIPDPLLAVEILTSDEWRQVEFADLPAGLSEVEPSAPRSRVKERAGGRRRRR